MKRTTVIAAVCVLALLVGAAIAHADITGLYYQEVEKDGRIYVFNTAERYASFQAAGEIGTAITLIGKGEGGKTLIAENETAADLYLFKHDLPAYEHKTPEQRVPYCGANPIADMYAERAMRLLNALYLQAALMVSRSHPAAMHGDAARLPG